MSEWKKVRLGDLAESVSYGYTDSATSENIGPHFLRITDIVPDQIDWGTVPYCKVDEKSFAKYKLAAGDIVIARTGATVGYAKLIRDAVVSVFASYLVRIRIDESKANPHYIGRIVESAQYKKYVMRNVNGAAQPNASAPVLAGFELPLPPRLVQDRIASVLSNYDSAIANCRRQIVLLEEAAMRLYKEWFKDGKGEKRKLVDVFSFERGCTITKTQVKRSRDDENRYTVYGAGKDLFGYYSKCNVCHRCVVVAAIGAGAGEVRRTLNEQSFVTSNSYIVTEKLRPMFSFMYQLLKSINFKGLNTGAAQPQISYNSISALDFMMPDSASIQRYCQIADKFVALEDQCYETIEKLTEARDRLLPKLMKGEIAV